MLRIHTSEIKKRADGLAAGSEILLSGTIYTARDAAHKKIFELLDNGAELPFELNGAVIYYAGPTPPPENSNLAVGACGPTTSKRMDLYTPRLLDLGLAAMIGKGERSREVIQSLKKNKALYFAAVGGGGAVYSRCIKKSEVIAFEELGCESVKKMEIEDFQLFVAVSTDGGSIYKSITAL